MPESPTVLDSTNDAAVAAPPSHTSIPKSLNNRDNRKNRHSGRNKHEASHVSSQDSKEGPPKSASQGSQRPQNKHRWRNRPDYTPTGVSSIHGDDFSEQLSSADSVREKSRRGRGPEGDGRGRNARGVGAPRGGGRKKHINAKLTNEDSEKSAENTASPARRHEAKADNLTNRLIHALRTPPFADCPICFNAIHPAQPIWCCSPSSSQASSSDAPGDMQCCYTPFHLKCIKSWASKSVKDMRDAYLARGETGKQGEWRCPGCQRKRLHVPSSYLCFCGSTPDPRPQRLATPHSCGNPCSRPRACNHACSLSCHPGPCPPCQVTTQLPCYCGRQIKSFCCSDLSLLQANGNTDASVTSLSCGNVCNKLLDCGKHRCVNTCHKGACEACPIIETCRCYCGKTSKPLKCGEGEEKHSTVVNEERVLEEWDGRFACENLCERLFDCGIHKCEKPCHPPSASPPPCPRSPSLFTHCPCGKKRLEELEGGLRKKCTDPIATCGSTCMRKLEGCEHVCSVPCHTGPCPPCSMSIIIPCRCGSTTRAVRCHEYTSSNSQEIFCDRPCTALRACGRHRCNRPCCPLAALDSSTKGKGKKRQMHAELVQTLDYGPDGARWHECDLICGKMLGCGNHQCEERDHRGACPPCLRSFFEEMICHCGRTTIEPPIPCGTRISCSYPCSREPPPCGHPKTPHTCHEDPTPCPPCPFLTEKTCACGKKVVRNVRCSQQKVSCGTACRKLLDCGFHHCERLCHGGDCGTCKSVCGKPRKLCLPELHGCTAPCHAPAACSEDEPCQAMVLLRCPCGRLQQPSMCGRSTSNPAGREATQQLKCTNDCAIAKRNARLAEALGISQETKEKDVPWPVTYSNDLTAFARANAKFCTVVEKTFADFVNSERKSQILPHMHEARRKFVRELAAVYRMDTQMIDQEPNRSVQLFRRIDTRIPKPLLSSVAIAAPNLGKLADLHSMAAVHSAPHTRPSSAASNPPAAPIASRGWTSVVVSGPAAHTPISAWDAPIREAGNHDPIVSRARTNVTEPDTSKAFPSNRPGVNSDVQHPGEAVPDDWENDDA